MVQRAFFAASLLCCTGVAGQNQPVPTSTCADQVVEGDVRRGKSAFWADCDGNAAITGCFQPGQYHQDQLAFDLENSNYGCQSCIVQEDWAAESVFAVAWGEGGVQAGDGLFPCPDDFDHEAFFTDKFGTIDVVTAAELLDTDECEAYPPGTFYYAEADRCYFKSTRETPYAASWDEAVVLCDDMGGALVALDSEEENDWFVYNLLWAGFAGETFTGLYKSNREGEEYLYVQSDSILQPSSFDVDDVASWYDGEGPWYPPMDASSEYGDIADDPRTCVEIYPLYEKLWNPFSCDVNKQYACELPSASCVASGDTNCGGTTTQSSGGSTTPSPEVSTMTTSAPVAEETPAPEGPAPTPAPTAVPTLETDETDSDSRGGVSATPAPEGSASTSSPSSPPTQVTTDAPTTGAPIEEEGDTDTRATGENGASSALAGHSLSALAVSVAACLCTAFVAAVGV